MNFRDDQNQQVRQEYNQIIKKHSPKSPVIVDCLKAFLVGGLICTFAQGVMQLGEDVLKLTPEHVPTFTAMVMVFLGALFTGFGLYDELGRFGGAGSAVPITGFANSIVAPAMEFRKEGVVMGTGARIFSIAGPVLVHGLIVSIIIALIRMMISG
jgi:stage V sporulation protein AC